MTVSWRGARSRATEPFRSPRLHQAHQPQPLQMAQGPGAVLDRESCFKKLRVPQHTGVLDFCRVTGQALRA